MDELDEYKDKAKGRLKEIAGSATGDRRLVKEGRRQVRRGRLKGAAKEIQRELEE